MFWPDCCLQKDFGLSRDLDSGTYYTMAQTAGAKIPIRWTAPEALEHARYGESSDIWSFGITVIELFSNSVEPYRGWQNSYVGEMVLDGFVHPRPDDCPQALYDSVIKPCLRAASSERPRFAAQVGRLARLMEATPPSDLDGYLDVGLDGDTSRASVASSAYVLFGNPGAGRPDQSPSAGFVTIAGRVVLSKTATISDVPMTELEAEILRELSEDTSHDILAAAKLRDDDDDDMHVGSASLADTPVTALEARMLDLVGDAKKERFIRAAGLRHSSILGVANAGVESGASTANHAYELAPAPGQGSSGAYEQPVSQRLGPTTANHAYEFAEVPDQITAAPVATTGGLVDGPFRSTAIGSYSSMERHARNAIAVPTYAAPSGNGKMTKMRPTQQQQGEAPAGQGGSGAYAQPADSLPRPTIANSAYEFDDGAGAAAGPQRRVTVFTNPNGSEPPAGDTSAKHHAYEFAEVEQAPESASMSLSTQQVSTEPARHPAIPADQFGFGTGPRDGFVGAEGVLTDFGLEV